MLMGRKILSQWCFNNQLKVKLEEKGVINATEHSDNILDLVLLLPTLGLKISFWKKEKKLD